MSRKTLHNFTHRLVTSKGLMYTFLRSGFSSQTAGWLDMVTGFVLFSWCGMPVWLATATGALAGGVLNCVLNYRFTFRAAGQPWRAVILKYTMVWCGSMLLNSGGTEGLYKILEHWNLLDDFGFTPKGYYAAARLTVSLIVSWFWNFVMQRYFVYAPTRFDHTAIAIMNVIWPIHRKNKSNGNK